MRGKSSPKEGNKAEMDINKADKLKEEPHLSGAYIRSLVKQLTSTRTKDPLNPEDQENLVRGLCSNENLSKNGEGIGGKEGPHPPPQQPPHHKKQVRRRLHTSRPYQERLLNMAEARREIVTALKFHRAAMKQQQQQQQLPEGEFQEPHQIEEKSKSRRNPRIYGSNLDNNFTSYVDNFSYPAFTYPPNYHPYPWHLPPVAYSFSPESLNLALPNQPLGLNLNFQDFNMDSSFSDGSKNPTIFSSVPSPSSSSSPPLSFPTEEVTHVGGITQEVLPMDDSTMHNLEEDLGLHHAMDDKEMAEIRSVGKQHQIEWDDTMNLVTSAWWFKFMKSMEIEPEENGEDFGQFPFDEIMEFPSWLNSNESCFEDCLGDYFSDDYKQETALPCMEIEEIEGMDGEWLSS